VSLILPEISHKACEHDFWRIWASTNQSNSAFQSDFTNIFGDQSRSTLLSSNTSIVLD